MYNIDIDTDYLGFSVIHRNTRHSIEVFLDLINLISDPEYISVLEYGSKKGNYNLKYQPYIKGKIFNIPAKYDIATKMYKKTIPSTLLQIASENNKHMHPNIFIDIVNSMDYNKKGKNSEEIIKH